MLKAVASMSQVCLAVPRSEVQKSVIVTAKSASSSGPPSEREDLTLSLLSLYFGFSVLPEVCPGAAELGQGRGGMM